MCGIVGVIGGCAEDVDVGFLPVQSMLGEIFHRGPDEQRAARLGEAVFGTARLALVDKPTSSQPMVDAGGRYLLSFNGEIYNHHELRDELRSLGAEFRTAGDTEVLLQCLIRWGADALPRLKGQFAVAFWDSQAQELLLARDRFGIVPLFWTQPTESQVAFASEIKALRAAGFETRLSVPDLVDAGVLWGVHPGRSCFAKINSVPPGSYVRWTNGGVSVDAYWRFEYAAERDQSSLDDQAVRLDHLLDAAVRRRVPMYGDPAVLLSGGLDSSAIVALLRRSAPSSRIESYSIQFAPAALNEAPFQLLAVDRFNTMHTAVTCDDITVAETLVRTIQHTELPLVRTAPASSMSLARRIEQNQIRAVLSGEGADELFCGYNLFKVAAIRDEWSRDPGSTVFPQLLSQVMQHEQDLGRAVERAFFEFGLDQRDHPLFSHLNRWASSFKMTRYLAPDLRASVSLESIYAGVEAGLPADYPLWSTVEQAQYLEVTYFLASALLASQCDRPYMSHSVEARYPFLDEDVVDFALTLPVESKLRGLEEKVVLKRAVGAEVPQQIVKRVKQPYTAPEGDVFRSAPGSELLQEYLSVSALASTGLFDEKRVSWLVRKLRNGPTSFHDDLALLWIFSSQVLATTYGVSH